MSEHDHSEPMNSLEHALANYVPAALSVDRDRLMFRAGRASAEYSVLRTQHSGHSWLWPASTAALAATSLALALALAFRPAANPTIVFRDQPAAEQRSPAHSVLVSEAPHLSTLVAQRDDREPSRVSSSYLKTREVAVRMGLDALGSPQFSTELPAPISYRDLWLGLTTSMNKPNFETNNTEKQTTM